MPAEIYNFFELSNAFDLKPQSVPPEKIREARKTMSLAKTAEHFGISVATVKRLQKAA